MHTKEILAIEYYNIYTKTYRDMCKFLKQNRLSLTETGEDYSIASLKKALKSETSCRIFRFAEEGYMFLNKYKSFGIWSAY